MFDMNKFCAKCNITETKKTSSAYNNKQESQRTAYARYIRNHMKTNMNES